MSRFVRLKRIVLVLVVVALVGAVAVHLWRIRNISLVEDGFDEAMEHGCFNCHGLGGMNGAANPGSRGRTVPAWIGGTHMMYIKSEAEIREWILDGAPARLRNDKDWQSDRAKALIHMPAFRGRIDDEDLDAVVAYFKAASMYDSIPDEKADQGRDAASTMGCFNCHGPEGRGCMPNPGSLKGYIPSWDGRDFPDLVRSEPELREWILDGVSRRLMERRPARFFLERQQVQMPAYRGRITDEQVQQIVAYIGWLRKNVESNRKPGVKEDKP